MKVVVPSNSHAKWAARIHENRAYISSALNFRLLRMASHFRCIPVRDQKPEAASSNSALVGRFRCGRACGRRSKKCLLVLAECSASALGASRGVSEGLGGAFAWGERVACGAGVCLIFGLELFEMELLLRVFGRPFFRLDVFAIVRVLPRNARVAVSAILGRVEHCGRRAEADACDCGDALEKMPKPLVPRLKGRLATWIPTVEALQPAILVLHSGAFCAPRPRPRPSSLTEHLSPAPIASPTFLFIIFAETAWS